MRRAHWERIPSSPCSTTGIERDRQREREREEREERERERSIEWEWEGESRSGRQREREREVGRVGVGRRVEGGNERPKKSAS